MAELLAGCLLLAFAQLPVAIPSATNISRCSSTGNSLTTAAMFSFTYPLLEDLDGLGDPALNYMTSRDNLSGRSRGGGHRLSGTRYSAGVQSL